MPEENSTVEHTKNADLGAFLAWMTERGFQLSPKLEIRSAGSLANMGTFACEPISAGELLFIVPRASLISPQTSSISQLLTDNAECLTTVSGWIPLILALMYERLVDPSAWRPYLRVAPNFGEHRLPLQWSAEERSRLLKGSGIDEEVENDLKKMEEEWREVLLPFVRKHSKTFAAAEFQDFGFFKDTVAFIIAYSFTEPSDDSEAEEEEEDGQEENKRAPFMVPMADMLNHSPANNAEVQYKADHLEVRAILDIPAGAEIFNTYGELSNSELLRHHGFALPPAELQDTGVDTVAVPLRSEIPEARWEALLEANFASVDDKCEAVFGTEGFVNPDFVGVLLSVSGMPEEELKARRSDPEMSGSESWLDALEEECEEARDFLGCREQLRRLPAAWRARLESAAKAHLSRLPAEPAEEAPQAACQRALFALRVCSSHRQLVQLLLSSLSA